MEKPEHLYDSAGRRVALGRPLGLPGGEGTVYEAAAAFPAVAKVFHAPARPDAALEIGDKLRAMIRRAAPPLRAVAAWPVDTLHDRPGGAAVGLLAPRLNEHSNLFKVLSPASRKTYFPAADWRFLVHAARNCAAAFETLHAHGCVVGDVSDDNTYITADGRIALIDCDSFQVRENGRCFLCTVGVLEYTPPELQGQDLARTVRTPDHDHFGLAVLIFRLLFMGWHPFAGRHTGAGEMPLDQAIREFRFPFSPRAAGWQMQPPARALPLGIVPPALAALFERAFTRGSEIPGARPGAADWRAALEGFERELRKCPADDSHRYGSHLRACPWCEAAAEGGPVYFQPTAAALEAAVRSITADPFDVAAARAKIEAVARPPAAPPAPSPPESSARAAPPQELLDEQFMARVVLVAAGGSAVAAGVGTLIHPLVSTIGVLVTVVLVLWWVGLKVFSKYEREGQRLKRQSLAAKQAYGEAARRWRADADRAAAPFRAAAQELQSLCGTYAELGRSFEAERRRLTADRQAAQRQGYLEKILLHDHKIAGIGKVRSATLSSYGIETAADLTRERLQAVPKFGPAVVALLLDWRREKESQFAFDPAKSVGPGEAQALVLKFRQAQQQMRARLVRGPNDLTRLAREARRATEEAGHRLADAHEAMWRAEAEHRAMAEWKKA